MSKCRRDKNGQLFIFFCDGNSLHANDQRKLHCRKVKIVMRVLWTPIVLLKSLVANSYRISRTLVQAICTRIYLTHPSLSIATERLIYIASRPFHFQRHCSPIKLPLKRISLFEFILQGEIKIHYEEETFITISRSLLISSVL